jgi:hypothetical protein
MGFSLSVFFPSYTGPFLPSLRSVFSISLERDPPVATLSHITCQELRPGILHTRLGTAVGDRDWDSDRDRNRNRKSAARSLAFLEEPTVTFLISDRPLKAKPTRRDILERPLVSPDSIRQAFRVKKATTVPYEHELDNCPLTLILLYFPLVDGVLDGPATVNLPGHAPVDPRPPIRLTSRHPSQSISPTRTLQICKPFRQLARWNRIRSTSRGWRVETDR